MGEAYNWGVSICLNNHGHHNRDENLLTLLGVDECDYDSLQDPWN